MSEQATQPQAVPEGYMKNAQGHLVPEDHVRELDILRDDLVRNRIVMAQRLRDDMQRFKRDTLDEVRSFIDQAFERYSVKYGGKEGNVTLSSYDGLRKIDVQVAKNIRFGPEIQAAKELIDHCIHRWTEDSDSKVKALVDHAFKTDQQGDLSTARIVSLFQLDIDDEDWNQAMRAIRDSMQVVDTSTYLRFYERPTPDDNFDAISLDFAKL